MEMEALDFGNQFHHEKERRRCNFLILRGLKTLEMEFSANGKVLREKGTKQYTTDRMGRERRQEERGALLGEVRFAIK
jgi:hypothetical protein